MSYGKMNGFAEIKQLSLDKDSDGFKHQTETVIATVRCYREGRHGSKRWANLALFADATDLFRFCVIPDVVVTADYVLDYDGERFQILSVENVKGRGMYLEVLAKKLNAQYKNNQKTSPLAVL